VSEPVRGERASVGDLVTALAAALKVLGVDPAVAITLYPAIERVNAARVFLTGHRMTAVLPRM